MKAYEVQVGVEGFEALKLAERPDPAPRAGQVLVRMRAASINYRDLPVLRGGYPGGQVTRPTIPLSDGAGEVVSVGEGVTAFQPGDKVTAVFTQASPDGPADGPPGALGAPLDGVLTELAVFHQGGLVKLPPSYDFKQGSTLSCAGVTAWNALFEAGRQLRPGHTVLALGSGGVSVWALQLARAAGCRVIATTSHDEKAEKLRALGASDVINYRTHPDWDKEVLRLTGGAGVDCVIEVGGAGTLQRSYNAVGRNGKVCLIGVLTHYENGKLAHVENASPHSLMFKSAGLHGISVGPRALLQELVNGVEVNRIAPVIDRVFPFEQAQEAYRYMASGAFVGKVVIEI